MSGVIDLTVDRSGIAWFKLNDVQRKNIFSERFISDFLRTMDEVEGMRSLPRVLILTGLSDVFCAGADKESLMAMTKGELLVKDLILSERLVNIEIPVIAAMEGHAIGGGLALACCCDVVIAARESRYGAVFMSMGFTPGMGTTTLLADLVGHYVASEMMLTAKRFKGVELERMNTNINHFFPKIRVIPEARNIARQIAEKNPASVRLLKYAMSSRKKHLLIEARKQEDMMHRISFGYPETQKIIEEFYAN